VVILSGGCGHERKRELKFVNQSRELLLILHRHRQNAINLKTGNAVIKISNAQCVVNKSTL
jgi:hypothetical protein